MSAARRYRRQLASLRTVWVQPEIPDDGSDRLKDGLAVRAVASRTGVCPGCAAEVELSGPIRAGTVVHAVWRHDDDCPALLGDAS